MPNFKIQVPTNIVRSSLFTSVDFVLIAKLIQFYYIQKEDKSLTLSLDHDMLMYYLNISDKRTLKKSLKTLYEHGIIENEIVTLPKQKPITITLNDNLINNKTVFTQHEYILLNKEMIQLIGYHGIRLLYYYESYINRKTNKQFCFVSMETIQKDLNMSRPTIIKVNEQLCKLKFIKKEQHIVENNWYTNGEKETYQFNKYNNHYYVQREKINKYMNKKKMA